MTCEHAVRGSRLCPHQSNWSWSRSAPSIFVNTGHFTLDAGTPAEVLADVDGFAHEPPDAFAWRHFGSSLCWDTDPLMDDAWRHAQARRRAKNEQRSAEVALAVLEAAGLRLRDASKWRALSLNPVLHPMFGPGLTAATNGVDVILLSAPSLTADWLLVHRTNIWGPVTGTPHRVADWDYFENGPAKTFARAPREKSARAKARELAEALL